MNRIEDGLAESQWYERSSWTVAYVHDEVCLADVDVFEIETGPCVVSESPEIRIEGLLGRDGFPVNPKGCDGIDDAA